MKKIPQHVILYGLNHVAVIVAIASANYWTIFYGYIGWVICGILGLSVCIHRSVTHAALSYNSRWLKWLCLTLSMPVINTSPIGWALAHRAHHSYLDQDGDPHTPWKIGFWRSYFHLWYYQEGNARTVRDLLLDKEVIFFHKYYLHVLLTLWVAAFLLFGLPGLLTVMIIGFWACHAFGVTNANFHNGTEKEQVRSGPLLTWLCWGENHHTYHHEEPTDHRFSYSTWDPSGDTAEFFARRGWVTLRNIKNTPYH